MINYTTVAYRISSRLKWLKNIKSVKISQSYSQKFQCVYERSCCACCVCYDRPSSEHVLVITSSTARTRHKYSWAPPTSRKKSAWKLDCADFLHSGTGSIEIAVFVLWLIFFIFFSERSLLVLKNHSRFQSRKLAYSGTGYIETAVFVPYWFLSRFQSRFQSRFSAQWNIPLTDSWHRLQRSTLV